MKILSNANLRGFVLASCLLFQCTKLCEAQNQDRLEHLGNSLVGATLFHDHCAACHGREGQGQVGPNLTDDFWIHGGSITDIFKTIKYGYTDKGMKSWKDDLSPSQIAMVASFIKSIHGTNPPNAKEKQGELYKEDGAISDSLKVATPDSAGVVAAADTLSKKK